MERELPQGYTVKKSDGRGGYEWQCPKGFNHYNFNTEQDAVDDALAQVKRKAQP